MPVGFEPDFAQTNAFTSCALGSYSHIDAHYRRSTNNAHRLTCIFTVNQSRKKHCTVITFFTCMVDRQDFLIHFKCSLLVTHVSTVAVA